MGSLKYNNHHIKISYHTEKQKDTGEADSFGQEKSRGRKRAILAYEISCFLFDFPVISLKNDIICCKSGWGWRVGLISELDFKEICFDFS